MVTTPPPTEVGTYSPDGSGFTMEQSAMETLQQQADSLRTGYQEASSRLSGQGLAGNAFGTAGAFAAEAFNASAGRSVELVGRAASTLGLVGEALKATARTHQEADRANGDQFARIDPTHTAGPPLGAPGGGGGGTPAPQGPPVASPGDLPGGPGNGGGAPFQTGGPQTTPTGDVPRPEDTTRTSTTAGPEAFTAQGGVPTPQGAGAPTGQPGGIPAGQLPPTPMTSGIAGPPTAPGGGSAEAGTAAARASSTPAPTSTSPMGAMPPLPEIPDPPPVPDGSASTGGGTNLAEALKSTPSAGGTGSTPGSSPGATPSPGATNTSAGTTPPPMPPIPEVPKDLFKQPGIPDPTTGSGPGGSAGDSDTPDPHPGERVPGSHEEQDRKGRDHEGRDGERRDPGDHEGDRKDDREGSGDRDPNPDRDRDEHGFPITSVDGEPCLDLRDLPAEDGERWLEYIRDILATKGEGSFFWAGDTIDAQGQRHSFMDLAEFMANLDGRGEPGPVAEAAGRPVREVSDTVAASPAHSANGDVYVLVGPNRAEDGPVELADFPALQANPRVERVFAIDAVTGRETQIHPKVS
ncbi:hypothetical protein ACFV4N_32550 [Actinosynnema sp. NPDC059797]